MCASRPGLFDSSTISWYYREARRKGPSGCGSAWPSQILPELGKTALIGGIGLSQRSKEFEEQVLEHMDMLHAVALRLTRNAADAEDLTQNTLVKALRFHDK